MIYSIENNTIKILDKQDFDIVQILECGQIFRFTINGNYAIVYSKDKKAEIQTFPGEIIITTDDVDYFATYWDGQVYLIPVSECSADKTLHLKKEKIRSNFAYAEDYIANEVLKAL